jgi:Rod binding domain-containing protein
MSALSPTASPPAGAAAVMSAAEMVKRAKIASTAKDFEASFLTVMLGEMFKGVGEGEFGGGDGAQMFRSFLTDAMSKQMSKAGGIGLAGTVQAEMLKLQGLTS